MRHLDFYFDPISPFACLAFERLPHALAGLSYSVAYRPVLFAGLLSHWGQKGPAEIEPKRAWTFRHVQWMAHRQGIEMHTPAQHPFNPLALLRLAIACAPEGGTPSRFVCEQVFRHVWRGGGEPNDGARRNSHRCAIPPATRSSRPCATAPPPRSRRASSACRRSRSTVACSGASTRSRCSARICAAMRGSTRARGTPPRRHRPASSASRPGSRIAVSDRTWR